MAEHAAYKVWIEEDLCTGDGICEEICPDVFATIEGTGIRYVYENDKHFQDADPSLAAQAKGPHLSSNGAARIPIRLLDGVIEAAEECPGECIFFDPV